MRSRHYVGTEAAELRGERVTFFVKELRQIGRPGHDAEPFLQEALCQAAARKRILQCARKGVQPACP